MKYFRLPDLGEGLPEAEIVEWHVQVGDVVQIDQNLVSVETAKAIVDVPSPFAGEIAALFGAAGDIIHTGEPLVEFAEAGQHDHPKTGAATTTAATSAPKPSDNLSTPTAPSTNNEESNRPDSGTVVGQLQATQTSQQAEQFFIGASPSSRNVRHGQATPAVRALAKRLQVDLDQVPLDARGHISAQNVEYTAAMQAQHGQAEPVRGVRRAMAQAMTTSHQQVVPVTLFEDADIDDWPSGTDTTLRLIRALSDACRKVPALNVWFDGETMTRRLRQQVNIAIAVDTPEGLFVPVLKDVNHRSDADLRNGLDALRKDVMNRTIPPAEMQGGTITLSNFGTMAGRYANPVVVPPQVAILGAGVARDEVVARQRQIAIRRILPLSLTFDHRAVTGGEAARFMAAVVVSLQKADTNPLV